MIGRARVALLGLAPALLGGCTSGELWGTVVQWSAEHTPLVRLPAGGGPAPCEATLAADGGISIGATPTGITLEDPEPGTTAATYRFDSTRVLVAARTSWERQGRARPDGRLWRVSCAAPGTPELFKEVDGADFGHGALSNHAATLFFTGSHGVEALNVHTREVRRVTRAPKLGETCWSLAADEPELHHVDVVQGYTADRSGLIIHRGAPCGFELDWVAQVLVLRGLDAEDEGAPRLHRPHPVATLALDAAGTLWLGDAGRCDEPGVRDAQTPGVVWISSDEGDSWLELPVAADVVKMHTAARTVLTDNRRAGRVVVHSARCKSTAASFGGRVFITRNSGKTWRLLTLDPEEDPLGTGTVVLAVALAEGSTDHLVVWTAPETSWVSNNGGQSWKADKEPEPLPEPRLLPVETGVARFVPTPNGLLRTPLDGDLAQGERVFPPGGDEALEEIPPDAP